MMDPVAKLLFEYLRAVIYRPALAALDVEGLPPGFRDFGEGLQYFAAAIADARQFAQALSRGELDAQLSLPGNEIASPLLSLQASLRHLTWQTQQVAAEDYQQRVDFMGSFSLAFNAMVQQLDAHRKSDAEAKSRLQKYVKAVSQQMIDNPKSSGR